MKIPQEILLSIAQKARTKRLNLDFSQKTLSEKSGVSYSVLKKFESTGKILLESFLKLAITLGSMGNFDFLFTYKLEKSLFLDELM